MSETRPRSGGPPRPPRAAVRLRPAVQDDIGAVAGVWHAGWRDGHLGHVPDGLVGHRALPDLVRLAGQRVTNTTVAIVDDRVVGFVVVRDDELEQLYVAADVRRRGVASALVARAEATIASRFDTAWLAVVAGNTAARRFYRWQGWRDAGPFDAAAPTADGPVPVPALRYTKSVQAATGEGAP